MPRRRKPRGRNEKPMVVVLTEDTGGVKDYISVMIAGRLADKVVFKTFGVGKGAAGLLSEAKAVLSGRARNRPKSDAVLIVLDQDSHDDFRVLLTNPFYNRGQVFTFASNLCFEMFFLQHYNFCSTPYNQQDTLLRQLRLNEGFEKYDKSSGSVPIGALSTRFQTALDNTQRLRSLRRQSASQNPYTDMDLFFHFVNELKVHGIGFLNEVPAELLLQFRGADR